MERIRTKRGHDEAQALKNAEQLGEKRGAKKERRLWQNVVADKDSLLADRDTKIAELEAMIQSQADSTN
ncbi:MAG: hypothetical protein FWB92_11425 [Oscillospiraceae bacterium]|nr:hypothetical protein [Oscillospiraceae bacterium]